MYPRSLIPAFPCLRLCASAGEEDRTQRRRGAEGRGGGGRYHGRRGSVGWANGRRFQGARRIFSSLSSKLSFVFLAVSVASRQRKGTKLRRQPYFQAQLGDEEEDGNYSLPQFRGKEGRCHNVRLDSLSCAQLTSSPVPADVTVCSLNSSRNLIISFRSNSVMPNGPS